jgi:hypothetical protein
MGALEDLIAAMLQGQGQVPGQAQAPGQGQIPGGPPINRDRLGGLLQAIVAMLSDPRTGGLEGLIRRSRKRASAT